MFHQLSGDVRPIRADPGLLQDWTGLFVAQLAAPSAEFWTVGVGGDVVLSDVATGSQAWTDAESGEVHQHGPLRLWDRVEDALGTWRAAGAPDQTAFGMTVTDETQTVWLGAPDGPSWPLPA